MNRARKITEILGANFQHIQLNDTNYDGYYTWDTTIGGEDYKFSADTIEANDRGGYSATIDFTRHVFGNQWTITQTPTDPKDAIRVFSAAVAFVKALMHKLGWLVHITFSANVHEQSRVLAYKKLAEIISHRTGGRVETRQDGYSMQFSIDHMKQVQF